MKKINLSLLKLEYSTNQNVNFGSFYSDKTSIKRLLKMMKQHAVILFVLLLIISSVAQEDNDVSCPQMCKCSFPGRVVNCQHQELYTLPENISTQVEILDLSYNNFDGLPRTVGNFKTLKTLLLTHNKIFTIDKLSLRNSALEKLDLSHNSIKNWSKIQSNVLSETNKLRELDLSYNPIQKLDYNSSLRSNSLEILSMQNCSLTNIPITFLPELKKLTHFIISHNKFFIPPILKSVSLVYLDVSKSSIHRLHSAFLTFLPNVQFLSLSNNEDLRSIRDLASDSLTLFNAMNCNLEHVNLTDLKNLTQVFLAGNRLVKITSQYFQNKKLRSLDLSENAIKFIDENAFIDLVSLEILNLSMNVFSELKPNTFAKNKKLTTLNLSRTYLTHMVRFNCISLRFLDMSSTEIQNINKDSLTLMPSLEVLKLSRNLITKLPESLKSDSLKELDLNTCQLTSINRETFTNLDKLEYLNLAGNRFTSMQAVFLPKNLKRIQLENNPWRCECFSSDFRQFYKYLVRSPSKILNENRLVCQSPENVTGYAWYQACAYVWYNLNSQHEKQLWYYLVPASVGTILLVAATCMRIRQQKIKRLERERRRQQLQAQERLRILRLQQQRERAQQNAPDPRDSIGPPSYAEAIRMPRIDNSLSSSTEGRNSILGSNSDLSKRNKRKKNSRRREQSVERTKTKVENSAPTETLTEEAGCSHNNSVEEPESLPVNENQEN